MRRTILLLACLANALATSGIAASVLDIGELNPEARLKLGKTADWVAISPNAVWVGSTGPFAVHRIDPATNQRVASVTLPGEACAGLALGLRALWVPLCTKPASLAKVDLTDNRLLAVFPVGPARHEGSIAASADALWLITNSRGELSRIDANGEVTARYHVAPGSFNAHIEGATIWISRAAGSSVSAIDAASGKVMSTTRVGPHPRFLTTGGGAVYTLNQGDGSVTRVDGASRQTTRIELHTPGKGGDIAFADGLIWSSMPQTPLSVLDANGLLCQWHGPGGDSLNIGFGSIWLTDYTAGTVTRLSVKDALHRCDPKRFP
jgi:hypothetical protein